MVRDICLVINNTGREIQVGDYWKKYVSTCNDTVVTPPQNCDIISRDGHVNIKPAEFIKRYDKWKELHNAHRCKWVFLSDNSENGVVLSKTDIHDSIGFVIMINGQNNLLVKEAVSEMDIKNTGERNESVEELKDLIISIVNNRINASAGLSLENLDGDKKKNASAGPSQEGKGKNCGQDESTSADPSRGGKVEKSGHDGQKNASADPSQEGNGKTSASVSET